MKLRLFTFFLAAIWACSKSVEPTVLKITVRDSLQNVVSGATVSLFGDPGDRLNNANQLGASQITDVNGVVSFSNLKTQGYFWTVTKGCLDNYYGGQGTFDPLKANTVNAFTSILGPVGALSFTCNSTALFSIKAVNKSNGDSFTTGASGISTFTQANLQPAYYDVRIVQETTIVPNPYDHTFTVKVTCGNTTNVTFPN